jgi:iron(III) transport system substrate-binding protein
MKKLLVVLIVSLLTLSLGACSNNEEPKKEESQTLTVYTPHPAETINIGIQEFTNRTGIKVEVVAAGTGELLNRMAAEKENPLGDVFWGGGAESLQAFAEYFEPYKPTGIEDINPLYYDSEYRWIGESPLPMVIMYNTNLVSEDIAPTSWADMLKPEFKGKIAMADPAKSGSAYTIMLTMIQAFGKETGEGWFFIDDFIGAVNGKILGSSSAVYKGVAEGEFSVGLTLEKTAIEYVNNGSPVKIVYPSEGTSAVPDAVGLIKGSLNAENAKKFIDFIISYDYQDIMAKQLSRRSIRSDVASPEGLPQLEDIKFVDYDFNWAASNKEELLNQFKEILVKHN